MSLNIELVFHCYFYVPIVCFLSVMKAKLHSIYCVLWKGFQNLYVMLFWPYNPLLKRNYYEIGLSVFLQPVFIKKKKCLCVKITLIVLSQKLMWTFSNVSMIRMLNHDESSPTNWRDRNEWWGNWCSRSLHYFRARAFVQFLAKPTRCLVIKRDESYTLHQLGKEWNSARLLWYCTVLGKISSLFYGTEWMEFIQ